MLLVQAGDEVMMPSFTFPSTANAFVLRGAVPVFIDIRADTLNIDERLIEAAITERTRAIVPVHYAGVGCEMEAIMGIAARHRLAVVEDAAQGYLSEWNGRALGTIGSLGAHQFSSKQECRFRRRWRSRDQRSCLCSASTNSAGKGTNRTQFLRGEVDKYEWLDIGSSYLPSDLVAAVLLAQLEAAER